jgi:hypothetical protein
MRCRRRLSIGRWRIEETRRNSGFLVRTGIVVLGESALAPHESELITALITEIRGYRNDVAVLHTKLFGDEKSENPEGRIPRLEASIKDHHARIRRQERREWMVRGMAALVGVIVTAAGFLYEIQSIIKGHK